MSCLSSHANMIHFITRLLPTDVKADKTTKHHVSVLKFLLFCTLVWIVMACGLLLFSLFALDHSYVWGRLGIVGAALLFVALLFYATSKGYYRPVAFTLVAAYTLIVLGVSAVWGVNNQQATLLSAFVIIISGILLGARYALFVALLSVSMFFAVNNLTPQETMPLHRVNNIDIVLFGTIFGLIALVSWLYNSKMEQSLRRAERSERALRRQKELLEIKVEERTRQVQAAQLERVQELYRFAELGHMSVALLHDMANYLSVLSLDIEDLKQVRKDRSAAIRRVQQSIRHLDSLISQVRHQIKGETAVVPFNIADEIDQVLRILEYKANAQRVTMAWKDEPPRADLAYVGSVNHFWQIVTNIVSNAIDAYDGRQSVKRQVLLSATRTAEGVAVHISDFGKGIPRAKQEKIFEPFYSTKKNGTGIGLAIAKRMVEKDFGGTISVTSNATEGTVFTIILPIHETRRRHPKRNQ